MRLYRYLQAQQSQLANEHDTFIAIVAVLFRRITTTSRALMQSCGAAYSHENKLQCNKSTDTMSALPVSVPSGGTLTPASVQVITQETIVTIVETGAVPGLSVGAPQVTFMNEGQTLGSFANTNHCFDFLDVGVGIFAFSEEASLPKTTGERLVKIDDFDPDTDKVKSLLSRTTDWWRSQGSLFAPTLLINKAANLRRRPMFFLPLAQCWGGSVSGHLEVSFYVAAPPAYNADDVFEMHFDLYTGYQGSEGGLAPVPVVEPRPPGLPAGEVCKQTANVGKLRVSAAGNLLSSPQWTFKMPIDYKRKAPRQEGAMDNQYFGILYSNRHDEKIRITNFNITFIATASIDAITPDWEGANVPASLNAVV